MSLSGGDAPKPQDPTLVAANQAQYNTIAGEQSQAGSNVNQFNPFGSLTYAQTGTGPNGVPLYSANMQLSPDQQHLLDTLTGTQKVAGSQAQNLLRQANYGGNGTISGGGGSNNLAGGTGSGGSPGDIIGDATSGNTKSLMSSFNQYMDPYFTTQTDSLDAKLRNQGLNPSGSSNPGNPSTWGPYERAMNQLRQGQGQTEAGAVAQFEPLAYNQAQSNYLMPLSMANSELGLSHPTMPNSTFVNPASLTIKPADYTTAVQNYQKSLMDTYTANKGSQNAMMSGLFGMGGPLLGGWAKAGFPGASEAFTGLGTAMGGLGGALGVGGAGAGEGAVAGGLELASMVASDRRLKDNIKPVGKLPNGLNIYTFNYIWDDTTRLGLMADEVELVHPQAVFEINGYKAVDYAQAVK